MVHLLLHVILRSRLLWYSECQRQKFVKPVSVGVVMCIGRSEETELFIVYCKFFIVKIKAAYFPVYFGIHPIFFFLLLFSLAIFVAVLSVCLFVFDIRSYIVLVLIYTEIYFCFSHSKISLKVQNPSKVIKEDMVLKLLSGNTFTHATSMEVLVLCAS